METEAKEYIRKEQLEFKREELLKVTDAIYDFNLLDLSRITVPTLIIAGEKESSIYPCRKNERINTKFPNCYNS